MNKEKICKNCKYYNEGENRVIYFSGEQKREALIPGNTCDLLTASACMSSRSTGTPGISWMGYTSNPQYVLVDENFGCVNFEEIDE